MIKISGRALRYGTVVSVRHYSSLPTHSIVAQGIYQIPVHSDLKMETTVRTAVMLDIVQANTQPRGVIVPLNSLSKTAEAIVIISRATFDIFKTRNWV